MTARKEHWLLPQAPYSNYENYLAATGPSAVQGARKMTAEAIVAEISRAGLRGRGGAGFPTAVKWRSIVNHPCPIHDVVCNAAEGEPGTFKDRYLLRLNPYACLEGMLIAAHVVKARGIYIGIKASFQKEIGRLRKAIEEMRQAGVIQEEDLKIIEGPEEYLFGEEKALLNFIEEGLPLPREAQYPPYEKGLFGDQQSPNPALVNNVETFSHIPSIIRAGADSFRALGSADTPGTVIFTVSGDVARPGIYEQEAGIPLKTLLYEIAGGPRQGKIKAVISGVSTGVITPEKFTTHCDFGSLSLIGSGLGSAGFVVYDESRSMPRLAQVLARFLYVESCNQCTACKYGLRTASRALDEIFDSATATPDDFERALYGAHSAPQGNRCYLPVQGSILIPNLMERFKSEFDEQVAHAQKAGEPIPVPLLKDFDERTHIFTYDTTFAQKNPDWTYEKETAEKAPPGKKTAPRKGSIGVRLAPDVLDALQEGGHAEKDLDRIANELLRQSLRIK